MLFFRRTRDGADAGSARGREAVTLSSRVLSSLLGRLTRSAERGEHPAVLLIGPPSDKSIESFTTIGCRVTVEGEDPPTASIDQPSDHFSAVLAFGVVDRLECESARALAREWTRVLLPGGLLYLVAVGPEGKSDRRFRFEILGGGELRMTPDAKARGALRRRQNRELESLLRPLIPCETLLRREGWREILFQKPSPEN